MSDETTASERSASSRFTGQLIAHRSTSDLARENLISGLQQVDPWVYGVEIDVRLTADKVPVLMHDPRIDRTTDTGGEIAHMSFHALRDARSHGEHVPTLEEYLDATVGQNIKVVLIDMKVEAAEVVQATAEVVDRSARREDCVLLSSARRREGGHDAGEALRALGSDLRLGSLGARQESVDKVLAWAQRYDAEMALTPPNSYLEHRECIPQIEQAGLLAGASTLDDASSLEAARDNGVGLILTNRSTDLEHF